MCGRMNVSDHPGLRKLFDDLGMPLYPKPNADLKPTQQVMAFTYEDGLFQETMTWGMKPEWSKRLLINAKSETVSEKRTFAKAFRERRCLVPCTGWYEWREEGGPKKQRYLFTHEDHEPFLMGGIWYPHDHYNQLITLTTHPNAKCAQIHDRMPVLIDYDHLDFWLTGDHSELDILMEPYSSKSIIVEAV